MTQQMVPEQQCKDAPWKTSRSCQEHSILLQPRRQRRKCFIAIIIIIIFLDFQY